MRWAREFAFELQYCVVMFDERTRLCFPLFFNCILFFVYFTSLSGRS